MSSDTAVKGTAIRSAIATKGAREAWAERTMAMIRWYWEVGGAGVGAHHDRRGAVDRTGHHLIAGAPEHRHRLPGQGGLVDARCAGQQRPVDADEFSWQHLDPVAGHDVLDGHLLQTGVREDPGGGCGGVVQQSGEGARRPILGVVLQSLAAGEHQADDQGGPVLPDQDGGDDRDDRQQVDAVGAGAQLVDHPDDQAHGQRQADHRDHRPGGVAGSEQCTGPADGPGQRDDGDQRVGPQSLSDRRAGW
nr:hypothetical protein [Acidipropionibacterium acidipropionici]